ncbi:LexA family transcriptional regulator [Clostridium sp.]|jgi:repressor LexA|uniref:LexA family protein n=1 Tax=Clostridium sp. TaxID=1506 RepID=UPI0025825FAA|nr:LexA family transcriptional regulator [Clostridium sp.]MDF2505111.1 response transcriptional repressor, RecA-mediated autopeptidase [Clostridium sp.]
MGIFEQYITILLGMMNMLFGDRLKYLREGKVVTQKQLGDFINVSDRVVGYYESDDRFPNDEETIKKIAQFFNISINDLFGYDSKQDKKLIPILGTIRAGIPILAEENWEGQLDIPNEINGDFALRVTGDSMSWTGITEGDYAVFKNGSVASYGDIVAAGISYGSWYATLKIFLQENNSKLLRAANPKYEDIQLTENHRIIGILVKIIKQPLSINIYRDFLISKDLTNTGWQNAIEKAVSHGLNDKELIT